MKRFYGGPDGNSPRARCSSVEDERRRLREDKPVWWIDRAQQGSLRELFALRAAETRRR